MSTRTINVKFDGDASGLAASSAIAESALSRFQKNAKDSARGVGDFLAKAALIAPIVGMVAGTVVGLSGVLGLLPGVAFAGALALGALKIGTSGFGDALKAMDDPAKFAEAIAKLSPAARATAVAIRDLQPQLKALKTAVQEKLFTGLATDVREVAGALLPSLKAQLVSVAGSFNQTAHDFLTWAKMPTTVRDINTALDGSRGFLAGILAAVVPVTSAFLDIGVVAAPYLVRLGEIIADLGQRFSDFIGRARETGQLNQWIRDGVTVFGQLWDVLTTLVQAVINIGIAFAQAGLPSLLQLVADALLKVSQFIRDNSEVMVPLIIGLGILVGAFKAMMVVAGIITAIKDATVLWTAAQWLFNAAMWANPVTWIVLAIVALIAIIILCIVYWDEIRAVVDRVVVAVLFKWVEAKVWLEGVWTNMRAKAIEIFLAIAVWIGNRIQDIISAFQWLAALPGRVGAWFNSCRDAALVAMGNLVSWLGGLPGRIIAAIGRLGSLLIGAGRDLVNGLWAGIRAGWDWLTGAVRSLASWLLASAKAALGIRSPSKLFRDEVGKWIPEGMAVGITANTGAVRDAAGELARTAVTAASPVVEASRAQVGLTAGAQTVVDALNRRDEPPTYVTVKIGDQELRALVNVEIDESNRELRRAVGV